MKLLRSIRFRITALATALVAVTLVVASLAILTLVRADLLSTAEETLSAALEEQALDLEQAYADLAFEADFDSYVTTFAGPSDFEVAGQEAELGSFLQDADGMAYGDVLLEDEAFATLVLDPTSGEVIQLIDPVSQEPLEDAELAGVLDDVQFGVIDPELYFNDPELMAAESGEPLLVGATSLDAIEASVDALQDALLLIVPLLLTTFAALAWWLVGRALKPVVSITARVNKISSANLEQRVPVPSSGDEVSELAVVMNRMLARLQRGDERQRQFSADASHELRSPLATLRTAAELIHRHSDLERARGLASDIVAESDRLDDLIGDLLELARLDEDSGHDSWEDVDLVELAQAEAARAELDGRATVKVVSSDIAPSVHGSARQLRRLVANLVDNACRHADSVVVTVEHCPEGDPVLVVADDGPGVAPEQADKIFERFSRLSEARDRHSGGTGLGLALVKAISERHGANIEVGRSSDGGAEFTVRFGPSPTGR